MIMSSGCPVGGLVSAVILCVVFGGFFALTAFQLVCIRIRSSFCSGQLILHSLILCSLAARFFNLVLTVTDPDGYCPTINSTNNSMPLLQTPPDDKVAFVVSLLPTAIFFSVNSYLVLSWTRVYFTTVDSNTLGSRVMKTCFIVSNVFCCSLIIAEMVLGSLDVPESQTMNTVRSCDKCQ